jgi:hypothetical protein
MKEAELRKMRRLAFFFWWVEEALAMRPEDILLL